jgi:hypothetical protein
VNTGKTCLTALETENTLSESTRTLGAEHLRSVLLGDTVGEGEGQVLADELPDVGALDILGLLELDNAEDLLDVSDCEKRTWTNLLTWIDLKRAR